MWWHTVTHRRRSEGGNWRMEWVASTLHTTSDHAVSSVTTADAHTSAASSRLNWRPTGRFKWTRPFCAKDEIWFLRVCHHISTGLYVRFLQQHPVYISPQSSTLNQRASRIALLFRDANAYGSSDKLYYSRRHSFPVVIKPERARKFCLLQVLYYFILSLMTNTL